MREDELSRVPKIIEPWRVMEFLRELGITPEDAYETTIGVRQVVVRMYATNEKGSRYLAEGGLEFAQHVISIPLVGPWKKPDEDARVEAAAIEVWRIEALTTDTLDADMNWPRDWETLLTDTEREEYRVKGRELLRRLGAPTVEHGPYTTGEEPQLCGHVSTEGGEVCELPEAHYFHRNGGTSWPHGGASCGPTPAADKTLWEGTWPEPELCDEEGPDGILCEERQEHDGEHQARGVFWGTPTR